MKAIKKTRLVIGRIVRKTENVETRIDGKLETTNLAEPGDIILRGPKNEEYVLPGEKVLKRYTVKGVDSNEVTLETLPVEVEFKWCVKDHTFTASWGEDMIAEIGDALIIEDDKVSYRIERDIFNETYDA